jgi:hypothetical protein
MFGKGEGIFDLICIDNFDENLPKFLQPFSGD